MATTITRTGGDTVISRTGLTDITITSTSDVEITYNSEELWINILVLGADDAPIALEVADITTVNGVNVTGYTIEQLVQYIADNCFGIVEEINNDLTVNGFVYILDNALTMNGTRPIFTLRQSDINKLLLGISAGASDIITGDVAGDVDFRTNAQSFNFSVNNGSGIAFKIKSGGGINMGSLPTSAAGLSVGDLWNDSGTLKIV